MKLIKTPSQRKKCSYNLNTNWHRSLEWYKNLATLCSHTTFVMFHQNLSRKSIWNCHRSGRSSNLSLCSSQTRKTFRNSRFKICGISSCSTTLTSFKLPNRHRRAMSWRLFIGKCTETFSIFPGFPNRTGWFLTCMSCPVARSMNIHGCRAYVLIGVPLEGWIESINEFEVLKI